LEELEMELSALTEAISAGFGVVHGGEGLDEAHDGAEEAEEGGDVGEKSDVGGAFFQLGDDLHHALFHGDFGVFPTADRPLARQPHAQHLGDGRFVVVGHLPRVVEIPLGEERLHLAPHLAVSRPDEIQLNPALDGDGHADGKDDENGLHEEPTLLKKCHH
jgi:hypothetical protein